MQLVRWLVSVTAIAAGLLLFPLGSSGRGVAELTWGGTWSTNFNSMTVTQTGSSVQGKYAWDDGHLTGTVSGSTLTGRWDEAPTRAGPNDAGPYVLTLSADGKSFTGKWRHDGDADWAGNWTGTCVSGACAEASSEPVPIASVSNGCGGAGWDSVVSAQNYLGNTSVYRNSNLNPLARKFTVNFKDACDLHDAGYGGAIVKDKLRGGVKDFRKWTRRQVDDKFFADMRLLCQRAIPAAFGTALANCMKTGGNASFGAESRYNFVRRWGNHFFDADLSKTGTQSTGPRANN